MKMLGKLYTTCKEKEANAYNSYCKPCNNVKQRKYYANGISETTKEYRRNWLRLKNYGITKEEWEVLWILSKSRCGICDVKIHKATKRGQTSTTGVIDHNHNTGEIRGLLCAPCNSAIGLLKENINSLKKAILWLRT